jgi:stearoyl-CoA desaturase (delta-9 desaturase)
MSEEVMNQNILQNLHEGNLPQPIVEKSVPASPEASLKSVAAPSARNEVRMGRAQTESGLVWITTVFMVIFHLGAIAALFFFSWTNLIVAIALYVFAINFGIGMGYHRLLVHRGYQVPKAIEYFLAVCGTLSLEGGPIAWVATHRVHHQHSDQEGDPHTPQEGKWWSHVGWIISGRALNTQTTALAHYAPDLAKDRFQVWLSKYHWVPLTLLGISLLVVGFLFGGVKAGISLFLWGIFLRVTLGLHATWLVNSATHLYGRRRFDTRDDSRNSWWVALVTGGEGWHNNHHANPVSARHGLAWYEFDPNYYGIWLLKKLGLARNVKIAKFTSRDPDEPEKRVTQMTTSR